MPQPGPSILVGHWPLTRTGFNFFEGEVIGDEAEKFLLDTKHPPGHFSLG